MSTIEAKTVLVCYNGNKKPIRVPPGENEMEFLKNRCSSLFKFDDNVRLHITFQKFDKDWDEMVDLEEDSVVCHKDKLNMVVQPSLMPIEVSLSFLLILSFLLTLRSSSESLFVQNE